ncbi:MAG TPA: serine hydrolase domain-containing protein [Streptomyces sp.]|nr:serine hydrolase domain-containing protein [Streptomyces sp.]
MRTTLTAVTAALAATAVALSVAVAAPAAAAPTASATASADHEATRHALRTAVADGVPGGTATVWDAGGSWAAAEGVGDLATGSPRARNDRYRIGSLTKPFVATVVLQLEAEGRLSLDDTVDRWLPGVVEGHGHDGRRITLRQLLNHTSGVYSYTADKDFSRAHFTRDGFFEHRYDTLAPADLVAVAMSHAPDFEPGTSWYYSNTNYVLAGMVVEEVTGRPYGEEIRRRVIEPLALGATSVPGHRVTVQPVGRGYSHLSPDPDGPVHDVTELNPSLAGASGEMISSAGDLNRFFTALLGGRLLPERQLTEMTTTVADTGYGLGLVKRTLSCGVTVWGHDGTIHGFSSDAVATRDGRHALALNFNADWASGGTAVVEAEFCGA